MALNSSCEMVARNSVEMSKVANGDQQEIDQYVRPRNLQKVAVALRRQMDCENYITKYPRL